MRFSFSDYSNANHNYDTPYYFFSYNYWYYFAVSVDYPIGKYNTFIYDDINIKWSYSRSVTPNNGYGFNKNTGYIFLGGDWYYEELRGKLKEVRFYYNDALS